MSPSRSRQPFVPSRPRSELYLAIAVATGIVVGTAALVWLIRPGTPGIPGGGGLFNRQPRMTMLVLLTGAALAAVVVYMLRGRRRPKRLDSRGAVALGIVVVAVLAVASGFFWPGGVIHHWPSRPKVLNTPPVTNPLSVPSTAVKTGTTVKSGTTVTTGTPSSTVSPSTTAPSTPTTKGR